jgi:hypothetical protein
MNCTCAEQTIVLVMGTERCATCGKVAGGDAFVPFGSALPTKRASRKRVRSEV